MRVQKGPSGAAAARANASHRPVAGWKPFAVVMIRFLGGWYAVGLNSESIRQRVVVSRSGNRGGNGLLKPIAGKYDEMSVRSARPE